MEIAIPTDINELIIWIGQPIVVSFMLSWVLERLNMWPMLSASTKQGILILVSIALPAASKLLQDNLSAELIEQLQPWWEVIVAGLMIYFGTQVAHTLRKASQQK